MKIEFKKLLLIVLMPLFTKGQAPTALIPWENGQVTVMSDMEPVWIVLKKGAPIKNARLWEVQNKKGILVYKKEGTLHDLQIDKITKITAGYNSKSAIFFNDENKPFIKSLDVFIYDGQELTDFKVTQNMKSTEAKATEKFISAPGHTVSPAEKTSIELSSGTEANDTIVREGGEIIAAKILEITPTRIKFKKANNMSGPTYILGNQPSVKIIRKPNSIKIIISE